MGNGQPGTAAVVAAQAGDRHALDEVVAAHLPLVYNVVGRALAGHSDVDDVVQETMLRVVDNVPELREPESFRSWLVSIALRQVQERGRRVARIPDGEPSHDLADPGADFVDLTLLRLELSGQRREVAEATRWLDDGDRELLSLWWLEVSGELTRAELASASGITTAHAAVRVQRVKAALAAARAVVRALRAQPRCPDLNVVARGWDGRPDATWRRRIARHTRDCEWCLASWYDQVPAERLLAGLALVPLPVALLPGVLGAVRPATPSRGVPRAGARQVGDREAGGGRRGGGGRGGGCGRRVRRRSDAAGPSGGRRAAGRHVVHGDHDRGVLSVVVLVFDHHHDLDHHDAGPGARSGRAAVRQRGRRRGRQTRPAHPARSPARPTRRRGHRDRWRVRERQARLHRRQVRDDAPGRARGAERTRVRPGPLRDRLVQPARRHGDADLDGAEGQAVPRRIRRRAPDGRLGARRPAGEHVDGVADGGPQRSGVRLRRGDDGAPVPQYLTRETPADRASVPQQSAVS